MPNWLKVLLPIALILAGCALPQWRVFQAKVDGRDGEKPAEQVEGEKRAAAYIAAVTTPPVAAPDQVVQNVHQVAASLAASLGEPKEPVKSEDKDAVIDSLRSGLRAKDEQLEKWRAFGRKYAGTPLEDTGINLAGPAGFLGLLGIIAACIFVPGFGWMLLRLLPVLWSALTRAVGLVERVAAEAPEAVAKLKSALPQKEDAARKAVRLAKRRFTPA